MAFMHAALLGGAALVVVPIVLHLIMRQQPKHLEFPALRFIKQREDANRRRLRLRHLLLLLMRCAVIALLALALARPTMQASGMLGDQEAPVAAALVFDTSPRLAYREQNRTRLQSGQETALWLMTRLPKDSEVAVVDSRSNSAVFSVDLSAARQRIERLDTAAVTLPLAITIEDALRLVRQSEKQRKELYIFTDLASSTWSPTATRQLQQRLAEASNVGVFVIDVGARQPQNFALGELRLSGQVLSKNTPLHVQTDLIATGTSGERTVELYLLDEGGGEAKRSTQVVVARAGEAQTVDFRVGNLKPGVHQGYVKIAGEDGLSIDDTRYFTVQVKPAWRVLIAAPRKGDAFFLSEALAPYALRIKKEAAFECEVVAMADLDKQKIAEYAAVCLLDPESLPPEVWRKLGAFANGGGGVAVFLGHNADKENLNATSAQELLPARLTFPLSAAEGDVYLAPENLQHPLMARFRTLESSIPWDEYPVFKHWQLGELNKGTAVVVAYSNNLPALLEKPLGKGRVLALTTPVSDAASNPEAWNALPSGWPFMVLANEMVYYLVGRGESKLNYLAGDTAVVHLAADEQRPMYSLTTPRGDQLRHNAGESQNALAVTSTETPGNYQLRAGGQSAAIRLGFSANLSPEVSQLERASDEQIKSVFGETPYQLARGREEINRSVNRGRVGVEWYPYLILLVALILGGEQILSNRFYRNEDKTGKKPAGSVPPKKPSEPRETAEMASAG